MKIEFKEIQRFNQCWVFLLLLGLGSLFIYAIYKQLIIGEPFGNKPMPDLVLIFVSFSVFGLITLVWFIRLVTNINDDEMRIDFFPLVSKRLKWNQISSLQIVNYGFLGGWGVRFGSAYGTVYNTRGAVGLFVQLKNGSKFCVGTQREEELKRIIEKITKLYLRTA